MRLRGMVLAALVTGLLGTTGNADAQTTHNSVTLSWTTPGDDSLAGNAAQFDIRYSTSAITPTNWASATQATGEPTPAASGTRQSFMVTGLSPATTYYFAIKTADEVPNWAILSNVITRTTLAAPDVIRPEALALAVTNATDSTVTLGWTATGDDSLTGTAASYDIRYSTAPITTANWASATQASGEPAPAVAGTAQSFMVRGLSRQVTYYFAAIVTDDAGNPSSLSNVPSVTTPDTVAPAGIRDLAASLVWMTWSAAMDEPRRVQVR